MFVNKFLILCLFSFFVLNNSYANPYALAIKEIAKASQTKEGQKAWGMANDNTKPLSDANANTQKNILSGKAFEDESNTTQNKLLTGGAMGLGGIGASKYFQAKSEESSDKEAEEDMKAYLETFKCKLSDKQYKGGEKNIQTDGGNVLIESYQEYKNLAMEVKTKKEIFEMPAGIESETIFDKAAIGLYDDVNIGKTKGAYASISNALRDENSEDAKKWNAQKETTKNTKIAGGVAAVAGIGGGLVGNMLLNKKKTGDDKSDTSSNSSGGMLDGVKSSLLDGAKNMVSEKLSGSQENSSGGSGILDSVKDKVGGLISK